MRTRRVRPAAHTIARSTFLIGFAAAMGATSTLQAQRWGQYGVTLQFLPPTMGALGYGVINNSGQVTGWYSPTGVDAKASIWSNGTTTTIGTLGGPASYGWSINQWGQVAGSSYLPGPGNEHAFVYDGTTMKDLGTLGGRGSFGFGINDYGQVVGMTFGDFGQRPFIYDGTTMRDIGTLGGSEGAAYGINDHGDVVGWSYLTNDTATHAFLYNGAGMRDLGTLGQPDGRSSVATAINDAGQAIGSAGNRGFFFNGTSILEDFGAGNRLFGLSNAGDVVGAGISPEGVYSAEIWESNGGKHTGYSLNDILRNGGYDGLFFDTALGISDDGQSILVQGLNRAGNEGERVVLHENAAPVTATPEPASATLMATGLAEAASLARRRRKNRVGNLGA